MKPCSVGKTALPSKLVSIGEPKLPWNGAVVEKPGDDITPELIAVGGADAKLGGERIPELGQSKPEPTELT